jgi:release factor glutamine methyltransferase
VNVRQKINLARARLVAAGIDNGEAGRDANLLARHLLGWDRPTLMVRETDEAGEKFCAKFDELIERRARREPVAYVRGVQEFWDRDFDVSPAVLIPRPETELIIEELLTCVPKDLPARPHHRIADIGTGSGCLAITAALEVAGAEVVATDISKSAPDVARANAQHHGVTDRVTFHEAPYLSGTSGTFDFILSNPPYVADSEYEGLMPEVREYEPVTALCSGEDGLRDIKQVIDLAPSRLTPGGTLIIEMGYLQSDAVVDIVNTYPALKVKKISNDLQNIPRVIVIERSIT